MNETESPVAMLARVGNQAQRFETPCGSGSIVWHMLMFSR
jgi:hypothetical protein